MTPKVVADSHSALWLSRFNILIPLKRRKSNYPETRNSWPIIPYLNRDGGEAVGLLEEHGTSRFDQDPLGPRVWHKASPQASKLARPRLLDHTSARTSKSGRL